MRLERTGKIGCGILLLLFFAGCLLESVRAAPEGEISGAEEAQKTQEVEGEKWSDAQYQNLQEELLSDYNFSEIDRCLEELLPGERITFSQVVSGLLSGKLDTLLSLFAQLLADQFSYDLAYHRAALIHILFLALIGAVLFNFSDAFRNRQIADTAFFLIYLLLFTLLLVSFQEMLVSIEESIQHLTDFMSALCPLYFLSVAVATGSATAAVFYELVLLLIFLVETGILHIMMPLLHINLLVHLLNHLSKEEHLVRMGELFDMLLKWILKTVLACIVGLNLMQGLLSPAMDTVQRSAVTKGIEAIPGVGGAVSGVAKVVLSTAVLIKRSIGVAGMLICILLCAIPLLKTALLTLLYKVAASLVEPISDKRITGSINSLSNGYLLLLQIVFTTGMLFLLTITVVTATSST